MLSATRRPYNRIRNVHRVRRWLSDGRCNYHHYHRPTRTKLPGQPGSPEFMAAYLECERRLKAGTSIGEEPAKLTKGTPPPPHGIAMLEQGHRALAPRRLNPRGV